MNPVGTAFARGFPCLNQVDYQQHSITIQGYQMKTCTKCGELKATSEFNKDASHRDGLRTRCKSCVKIYVDAWAESNKDRKKATNAAHYQANIDRYKSIRASYYEANKEKIKESNAAWHAANPESLRIRGQNRRARKRDVGGTLSKNLTKKLHIKQSGKCACCGKLLGDDYHLDHRMPLALGGVNEDWNMQLLTATCNKQKAASHPVDFMQRRGYLL